MRKRLQPQLRAALLSGIVAGGISLAGIAQEPAATSASIMEPAAWLNARDEEVLPASLLQDPLRPVQPRDFPSESLLPPSQPRDISPTGMEIALVPRYRSQFQEVTGVIGPQLSLAGDDPAAKVASDLGRVLSDSANVQGLTAQQRNPTAFDPHIRGYHVGQIYTQANGEYWMPVRNDLDSMLTKIDPKLIQDVVVIPGPYAAQYGPGFSFIDVVTRDTPRYECFEWHDRISVTPSFNGGQLYASNTVYGGNSNYGFIVNYGNRTGSDYLAGNSVRVPASYHDQNVLAQFGWDLSDDSKIEVRYNRLDRTNAQYALQFFDVNFLGTDSFSGSLITSDELAGSVTRIDAWYNRTRFYGDTLNNSSTDPNYNVIPRVENALANVPPPVPQDQVSFVGYTNGDLTSAGARAMRTYGDIDESQLKLGADLRYLQQFTFEQFDYTRASQPFSVATNQPQSTMVDPGLFTELSRELWTGIKTRAGGRVDWVSMDAQTSGGTFPSDPIVWRGPATSSLTQSADNLPQNEVLVAGYWLTDFELTQNWKSQVAAGYAERAPTLTERYADGVFLAILQSGFTRVIGNPLLSKEKALQADWSVTADYQNVRARATVFYSWIWDYVTYQSNVVTDPSGAYLLRALNTDLATLAGAQLQGELDLTQRFSLIGSAQYVDGRDRGIDAPLPQISPLEGRAVLRWADRSPDNVWGVDFGMRMVRFQERLGTLRLGNTGDTVVVESATPGFSTLYVRGFYNASNNLSFVGGIDNLGDRTYYEHLNRRLPQDGQYPAVQVLSPGITPYFGVDWIF